MTTKKADQMVDRAASWLEELAGDAARDGGLKAKLAEPLAEDAAFLRKLKPSLIAARARGQAPTDRQPETRTAAPSGPQLGPRPRKRRSGGVSPFLVIGAAFAAGIVLAKVIDWRGHAHPRS